MSLVYRSKVMPSQNVTNSNDRATNQHRNACYNVSRAQHDNKAYIAVIVALSQYHSVTFSVEFRRPDKIDYRIVCLHNVFAIFSTPAPMSTAPVHFRNTCAQAHHKSAPFISGFGRQTRLLFKIIIWKAQGGSATMK